MTIKRIDHIAVVVTNIEEAQTFYRDALGMQVTHIEQVDDQEVIAAFLPAGDSELELVEPITGTSGVARYLAKRGPGVHHIALEVDSIEETLAVLKAQGVRLIDEEPTIGSGGKKIAFIHPKSAFGVLIELYETTPEEPERRADILEDLRTRFEVERQALSAGMSAFLRTLRAASRAEVEDTGDGPAAIVLKAEGEVIDEEE